MTEFEDTIYSNFSVNLSKNDYEGMFASLESHLGKKPTLYEYHCLYRICIDYIAEYYLALPYANDLIEKMNCIGQYNWFKHELDNIFNEYAAKVLSDIPIVECMKIMSEKSVEIANYFNGSLEKIDKNGRPAWKQSLIDKAYLDEEDGETLMTSIDEAAAYLSLNKYNVSKEVLQKLKQRNGESIKDSTAIQVASRNKNN